MRAKEIISEDSGKTVTINIPITITIPSGSGDPVVSAAQNDSEMPEQPVFVPPLQQELELAKHKSGKRSPVLNQILDDNGAFSEDNERTEFDIVEDFQELSEVYNQLAESKKS
jgi:predicted nucleic acid binding AN1-type Zn finger protein